MSRSIRRHTSIRTLASLIGTTSLLAACGGGSGGGEEEAATIAPPPAIPLVAISGVVADGPLSGVTVCYDLNDNAACDTGEPASALTDGDGRYTFSVEASAVGKHAVIAEVPATAVDKDTGVPVGTAFTLRSPATGDGAAQSVFVSPLTTLVQVQIDATGGTLVDAADFIKAQAGLSVSPMADFTTVSMQADAAGKQAALVARLSMLTWMANVDAAAGAVGQTDLSGAVATAKDLRNAAGKTVLGQLPAVANAVADAAVAQAADAAARTKALGGAAADIVGKQGGLTSAAALASIGTAKLPADVTVDAPAAGASLPSFRYIDADNWFYRAYLWTAADNTPDEKGGTRFYDMRSLRNAGTTSRWGFGGSAEREGDLHWSGSAWIACPLGTRSKTSARDAQGRASGNYCDGFELNASSATSLDISGKTLRSVVETIRAFPGTANGVAYAEWGPQDLALLGSATLPAGSKLRYQTTLPTRAAYGYDARASVAILAYLPEIAAGGNARGDGTAPCRAVTNTNVMSYLTPATSLDDLMTRNPGTPCSYNPNTTATGTSGDRNDWWGNSTIGLGSVASAYTAPAGSGNWYSTAMGVRVGFVAGTTTANFYGCPLRATDNSPRNCTLLSTGAYVIETLGDARVMRFSGMPALALGIGSNRMIVERGGKVYVGYQNPTGVSSATVRLNLTASNALFSQLGLPALMP